MGGIPSVNNVTNPALGNSLQALSGAEFVSRLISSAVGLLLIAGAVIFVFILILGAISWITSGGDKANVESARGKVTAAIIGLFILFSVWAIINLIESIFRINILTLDILNLAIQ